MYFITRSFQIDLNLNFYWLLAFFGLWNWTSHDVKFIVALFPGFWSLTFPESNQPASSVYRHFGPFNMSLLTLFGSYRRFVLRCTNENPLRFKVRLSPLLASNQMLFKFKLVLFVSCYISIGMYFWNRVNVAESFLNKQLVIFTNYVYFQWWSWEIATLT